MWWESNSLVNFWSSFLNKYSRQTVALSWGAHVVFFLWMVFVCDPNRFKEKVFSYRSPPAINDYIQWVSEWEPKTQLDFRIVGCLFLLLSDWLKRFFYPFSSLQLNSKIILAGVHSLLLWQASCLISFFFFSHFLPGNRTNQGALHLI